MRDPLARLIRALNSRDADTLAIALDTRADQFAQAIASGVESGDIAEAWKYREGLCRAWAAALRNRTADLPLIEG